MQPDLGFESNAMQEKEHRDSFQSGHHPVFREQPAQIFVVLV